MNFSKTAVKEIESMEQIHLFRLRHDFIMRNVPRWHRLLMEAFPSFVAKFAYSIAHEESDPTKLTLLRGNGNKMKVIARNYKK